MAFGPLLRKRQLEYNAVHDSPESLNSRKQRAEAAIAYPGPSAEIAVAQVNAPPNRGEPLKDGSDGVDGLGSFPATIRQAHGDLGHVQLHVARPGLDQSADLGAD